MRTVSGIGFLVILALIAAYYAEGPGKDLSPSSTEFFALLGAMILLVVCYLAYRWAGLRERRDSIEQAHADRKEVIEHFEEVEEMMYRSMHVGPGHKTVFPDLIPDRITSQL